MISSLGAGSGLDLGSLVDQLLAAERAPAAARLNAREGRLQAEISAFASLTAAVDKVRDAMDKLGDLDPGKSAVVAGDLAALTASATDAAPLGTYQVAVNSLASHHSVLSDYFSGPDAIVGGGSLTIAFGTTTYTGGGGGGNGNGNGNGNGGGGGAPVYDSFTPDPDRSSVNIDIDPGSTLAEVRDAINAADAGFSATLISDEGGHRILISSQTSGAAGSLDIQVSDDDGMNGDAAGLSRLSYTGGALQMGEVTQGLDASFSVNGVALTSASNTGITSIDGLEFDLLAATTEDTTVKVSHRRSAVTSALEDFISAYNEFADLADELSAYDPDSGRAGTLQGDSTLRGMSGRIRAQLSAAIGGAPGAFDSLVELGIETSDTGRLSLDGERLDDALDNDFSATVGWLNSAGSDFVDLLDTYAGAEGLLGVRSEGAQSRLQDINDQRAALDRRLGAMEARLVRQFANLDSLIAGLQSTSNFISSQLATLDFSRKDG